MSVILRESPLLALFIVASIGYLIGRAELFGFSLGVSAVLFAGLGMGALVPQLEMPEIVPQFGLVLFVYGIGVASGPGFFAALRRRGLRDNGLAVGVLVLAALLLASLRLGGPTTAGVFAGALTNTPALAGVLDTMKAHPDASPVVAYSVTYPMGVIGVILALWVARRFSKGDGAVAAVRRSVENATVLVTKELAVERAKAIFREHGLTVLFGRMKRAETISLVPDDGALLAGDRVTIVGSPEDLRNATELLGDPSDEHIDLDRRVLDFRRMVVSDAAVTERPLASLRVPERFGAIVTRLRRGDVDLLPAADTELQLGDRVRVLGPRERMAEVAKFFGDSYKTLSEIDHISFGAGIALGLLVGSVGVPLPGGGVFKLGLAGGPLVVGLVLGRLGRTGPLVWSVPYSASLTLRQLGLVMFFAGVGTRSGHAFVSALGQGALPMFLAGAGVTFAVAASTLLVGRKLLKIPMESLAGIVAGVHTQPAALAFASQDAKSDAPNVGYASVFPLATIAKIVLAQVLLRWL